MSIHDGSECGCCGAPNPAGAPGFYYCPACRAEDSRLFQAVLVAEADARETARGVEADADKPVRWVCARCNHARDLPAECGAPTTGWECPACVRRPLSPFEMLGVLDVCHDRIPTTEERRPARTTRLVRLESVVVQTGEGRALVTARRCPGCGVHILSDGGGNICALCADEQKRKFGRDR